jgi:hypothetical protein
VSKHSSINISRSINIPRTGQRRPASLIIKLFLFFLRPRAHTTETVYTPCEMLSENWGFLVVVVSRCCCCCWPITAIMTHDTLIYSQNWGSANQPTVYLSNRKHFNAVAGQNDRSLREQWFPHCYLFMGRDWHTARSFWIPADHSCRWLGEFSIFSWHSCMFKFIA